MAVIDRMAELEQRLIVFFFFLLLLMVVELSFYLFFFIFQGDKGEVGMRGLDGNPGIKVLIIVLYFITCKDDYCVWLLSCIEQSNHFFPQVVIQIF